MAASLRTKKIIEKIICNVLLTIICFVWTVPTFGLLVTSFRNKDDVNSSGWWTIGNEYKVVNKRTLIPDIREYKETKQDKRKDNIMIKKKVEEDENTNKKFTEYYEVGYKNVKTKGFGFENYYEVFKGGDAAAGSNFSTSLFNSLAVTIPATIIPILIAAFAAYGFAWIKFPGRKTFFTIIVALLVVPLQISLIPILISFKYLDLNGTFLAVWLAHTGFGLPLAIYLLYNYISTLPKSLLESAFLDGASHFTCFIRLILPLSVPALAAFCILQFMWVWNDLLVALVFLGTGKQEAVLTAQLLNLAGSRGSDWHLLTAGAFVTMFVPMVVFFSLQRFFVRGMMAGAVKE